jgi:hypothetical protein
LSKLKSKADDDLQETLEMPVNMGRPSSGDKKIKVFRDHLESVMPPFRLWPGVI